MTLKLTSEQLAAIKAKLPGQPVQFEDEECRQRFWLIAADDLSSMWSDYIRNEVNKGVDAIERGEIVDWNPEAMKQLARAAAAKPAFEK